MRDRADRSEAACELGHLALWEGEIVREGGIDPATSKGRRAFPVTMFATLPRELVMRKPSGMLLFGSTFLFLGVVMSAPASAELRTTIIRVQATSDVAPPPVPAPAPAPLVDDSDPMKPLTAGWGEPNIEERDRDYIPHAFPCCIQIDCRPSKFCPRGWCGDVPTECFRRDYARYVIRTGATDHSETPVDIAYYRRYCRPCRDALNRR